MGGTREGALKAAAKLKAKDPDYYKKLRAKVRRPAAGKHAANGFDKDPERARSAGAKGGSISRRRKAADVDQEEVQLSDGSGTAKDQSDQGAQRSGARRAGQDDQPTSRGGQA